MYFTKRVLEFKLNEKYLLLFNTISSALDNIDFQSFKEIKENIDSGKNINYDKTDLINQFYQRGYLFDDEASEIKLINKLAAIHQEDLSNGVQRNYTICPTMGCNLRCVYCFEGEDNHCNHSCLTQAQLNTILTFIKNDLNNNVCNKKKPVISLYGGEPLLISNYSIIENVLDFASLYKLEVRIVTNGTTISKFKDLLKKYDNVAIQITLDGAKRIHDLRRITASRTGSFDTIVQNIDELIKIGVPTHLRTNIDYKNIESLAELIGFIKMKKWVETGLVYPYVAPVLDYCDGSEKSMKESDLYKAMVKIEPNFGCPDSIIKKISSPCINFLNVFFDPKVKLKPWKMSYCEATSGGNFVFSPDGNISTCLMLAGKGVYQIGTFDASEVRIDSNKLNTWTERTIYNLEKCKDCKYSLICGGGCPMAAINLNKDLECPFCSDIAATIEAFVEHHKDDFLKGM